MGDYVCTWSLVDESESVIVSLDGHGMDAIEALVYTVAIIGDRLALESGEFSWHGLPGPGLPRHVDAKNQPGIISIFADIPGI